MIWRHLPNKPKRCGWAFYYYLLRRGDEVVILESNGRDRPLSIEVLGINDEY